MFKNEYKETLADKAGNWIIDTVCYWMVLIV